MAANEKKKPLTKGQLYGAIAEEAGLTRAQVSAVFEALNKQIRRHLKSGSAGTFNLPGLAKVTVTKKPATKERKGVNPFTGEPTIFKAKPARRVVKVRALKGLKDLAG